MVSQGGRGLRTCSGSDWTGTRRRFLATRAAQIRFPAVTRLTERPSASIPTGVAPRSAETLRTRSPCGLVHVAVGRQHQSEAQNPRKAELPRLAVRDNVFMLTRRENMAFAGNGQGRFFPTPRGRRLPGKCTWWLPTSTCRPARPGCDAESKPRSGDLMSAQGKRSAAPGDRSPHDPRPVMIRRLSIPTLQE